MVDIESENQHLMMQVHQLLDCMRLMAQNLS